MDDDEDINAIVRRVLAKEMAPKREYTKEQMKKAIEDVQRGEKVSVAATKYNVPRITLRNKVMGISPMDCNLGPSTVLSEEEETLLVTWILFMAENHFPITKEHLLDSVQKIVMEKQMDPCPFTNHRPGKKWYASFLKRHPEITERTAQNLTKARDEVTEDELKAWFKTNKEYIENKGLLTALNDPTRIYNCDESAFFLQPKAGRVLARKGDKNIHSGAGDEKENLTVLVTANAAGSFVPPMIVYGYERIPKYIGDQIPDNFATGKSDTGWMTAKTFYEYVANIFNPWLAKNNITKPVLLFVDGHRSHMTLHLSNFCKDNGIEIIALHPNSTHLLQPMDVAVFRPLKCFWKSQVMEWKLAKAGQRMKKENFAPNFKIALEKISKDVIKNGFRKSGLYPYGPEYVDISKISSHNRASTSTHAGNNMKCTEKIKFIKVLEQEIEQTFSTEKLNIFKKLYYLPRDEVENILAPEDESLYVIWAKNKNFEVGTVNILENFSEATTASDSSTHAPGKDIISSLQTHSNSLPVQTKSILMQQHSNSEADISTLPESSVGPSDFNIGTSSTCLEINKKSFVGQEESKSVACSATPKVAEVLVPITLNHIDSDAVFNSTPQRDNALQVASVKDSTVVEKDMKTVTSSKTSNSTETVITISSSTHAGTNTILTCTPQKTIIDLAASTTVQTSPHQLLSPTPQKLSNSVNSPLGINIPSPFKRALHWPEPDKKKKRTKEQLPSVITGEAWRAIMAKKDAEKKQQLEEKERRKKEREEKKFQKEMMIQEKKKIKENIKKNTQPKQKQRKKKQTTVSSTDETDTDIEYDDSEYDVQDDLDAAELDEVHLPEPQETKNKESIRKRKIALSESASESDDENLPLNQVAKLKLPNNFCLNAYVIIQYEGEYFPGIIKNIDKEQYEISTMVLSKGNTFRWPENPDQIWYHKKAIIEKIKKPILFNKRGFFKVKEMEKYLPFVSL